MLSLVFNSLRRFRFRCDDCCPPLNGIRFERAHLGISPIFSIHFCFRLFSFTSPSRSPCDTARERSSYTDSPKAADAYCVARNEREAEASNRCKYNHSAKQMCNIHSIIFICSVPWLAVFLVAVIVVIFCPQPSCSPFLARINIKNKH